MPIVKTEENGETTYVAAREGSEISPDAVVAEYEIARNSTREGAEQRLREDYVKRLEQHAHDCALLEHLIENPPDEEDSSAHRLSTVTKLARRVAEDAIALRTNDPFVSLFADVVKVEGENAFLTHLVADGETYAADDDGWGDSMRLLYQRSPSHKAWKERQAHEKAERDERYRYKSPAANRLLNESVKLLNKASATEKRYQNRGKRRAA